MDEDKLQVGKVGNKSGDASLQLLGRQGGRKAGVVKARERIK